MKRLVILFFSAFFILSMVGCNRVPPVEEPEEPATPQIVMVTSEGGLGDQSFNDMAYEGVQQASSDFQLEIPVLEPNDARTFFDVVEKAAMDGANLVIAVGGLSADEMTLLGDQYPDTSFTVVDSDEKGPDNIMSLSFKDQEGAFLVGAIAALTTKTDIIGFVGGVQSATIDKFEFGFRAGVKAINPNAQVLVHYLDHFDAPELGKKVATEEIDQGADVIFHAAGESGIGVIEAAKDLGVWAIGVDKDQSSLAPESVLCSMLKRVDHGVYFAIQSYLEGDFEGGIHEFGLDYEAVGYTDEANNLSKTVREQADAYAAAILSGDIYVPKNEPEFEDFTVPDEGFL